MQYLLFLGLYIACSYFTFRIAKKLGSKLAFFAWIPFLSDYLITRLAQKKFVWWILMYVPIVNIYVDFILWKKIVAGFNKNFIYAILMLIPVINWALLFLFAFDFEVPEIKSSDTSEHTEEKEKEEVENTQEEKKE